MEDHHLTDSEKDEIAELAANKAYDRFYLAVGKSITKKILWVLGASIAAIWYAIEGGNFK
jgi:hypothetical protein|tara:strand:+ start:1011 stop:1190 length:180 start_codon:yes stop_codon:yes gene_type:complete